MDLAEVYRTENRIETSLIQSMLQADAVTAELFDDVAAGVVPGRIASPIRIMVASTQRDRAREIVTDYIDKRSSQDSSRENCVCGNSAPPKPTIPLSLVILLFLLGIFPGVVALYWHKRLICPQCRRARGRA